MDQEARWYVAHTYSGYENKVAATIEKTVENRHLEELILDVRVPMETVTEFKEDGAAKEVDRKLCPGYVLIKMHMTDESWYIVRNTRGVTSFVGPGSKPVPLTEQEVAQLGVEVFEVKLSFAVGDSVKVIDGALEGFIGVVDAIDVPGRSVTVTVNMFGRDTPVELKFGQVAALER